MNDERGTTQGIGQQLDKHADARTALAAKFGTWTITGPDAAGRWCATPNSSHLVTSLIADSPKLLHTALQEAIDKEELARTQLDFRAWSMFRSRDDRGAAAAYYATRNRTLTDAELYAGLHQTVHADTPAGLRACLNEQTHIEAGRLLEHA